MNIYIYQISYKNNKNGDKYLTKMKSWEFHRNPSEMRWPQHLSGG